MSERDTQIERDVEVGLDDSATEGRESALDESTAAEDSSWLRRKVGTVASSRSLLIGVVLAVVGGVLFGAIPFVGLLGNLLGIGAGGFVYGLSTSARRYLEMAIAGAVAGAGIALLGNVVLALVVTGGSLVALGAAGGAVAGVIGHYFGRDLRAGLTRDLGEAP